LTASTCTSRCRRWTAADLILPPPTEGSREVAERVALARERQAARYAAIGLPHLRTNAAVSGAALEDVARPDTGGLALLREAADVMRLSARGYHLDQTGGVAHARGKRPPAHLTRSRFNKDRTGGIRRRAERWRHGLSRSR
jgi:hypothetical protein